MTSRLSLPTDHIPPPIEDAAMFDAPAIALSKAVWEARTPAQIRADTIAECIAALSSLRCEPSDAWNRAWNHGIDASKCSLSALLPQPDKAKDLVDQWIAQHERDINPGSHTHTIATEFARWLIAEGMIA